jgi:hypothetical protein
MPVFYNDTEHRYYLGNRTYRSSTQIVEKFITPFDREERSTYMADRYGKTQDYWKKLWDDYSRERCTVGTNKHKAEEDFLYNRGFDYINSKRQPVYKIGDLYDNPVNIEGIRKGSGGCLPPYFRLPDGIYPELKVWNHEWGIAGRIDKPTFETIGSERFVHIEDYKTSKNIRKRSIWEKHMLGPISYLEDCEFIHYSLQLSIYMFMMEAKGFRAGSMRLIHFPHKIPELPGEPSPVPIEVPYLRNEVIMMLEHLKSINWLN